MIGLPKGDVAPTEKSDMAAPALAQGVGTGATAAPASQLRWLVVGVACVAALGSIRLAFASDQLSEPGLQAALLNWITLPYIVAGAIAWSRRPDSRFGPLMVAAGCAMFFPSLQWSNAAGAYTIGLAFDLLPAALFLHLFLAFPSGRLERQPERAIVAASYAAAIGLQFVKALLGGAGPRNGLALFAESNTAGTVEDVELIMLSALCLGGIAVLVARRREAGPRPRRRIALLGDSFWWRSRFCWSRVRSGGPASRRFAWSRSGCSAWRPWRSSQGS